MVSDVLFQAVQDLDHYLNDPVFANVYGGALRERLLRLRKEMQDIRMMLDSPPPSLSAGQR